MKDELSWVRQEKEPFVLLVISVEIDALQSDVPLFLHVDSMTSQKGPMCVMIIFSFSCYDKNIYCVYTMS